MGIIGLFRATIFLHTEKGMKKIKSMRKKVGQIVNVFFLPNVSSMLSFIDLYLMCSSARPDFSMAIDVESWTLCHSKQNFSIYYSKFTPKNKKQNEPIKFIISRRRKWIHPISQT